MKLYEQTSLSAMIDRADFWKDELDQTLHAQSAVIRGLFDPDRLRTMKAWVYDFRLREGLSGNMAYNDATPDHVKLVDKPLTDRRPTRFVLSQFFPWNNEARDNRDIGEISANLMRFRNLCSGLAPETGFVGDDTFVSWPSVIQYRRGGDFLAAHQDDYAFQCILILSQMGEDFSTGGNYYLGPDGHRYLEPELKFGDVLLLKSDLVHGVHPIDPHQAVEDSAEGRWMMFCPLARRDAVIRPSKA